MPEDQFATALDAIEDIAETDVVKAVAAAINLADQGLTDDQAAELKLMTGSLLARSGQFEEATVDVSAAQAMAAAANNPELVAECKITLASIKGASGDYSSAIRMLKTIIKDLETQPNLAELKADAMAELRAYTNVVTPKNAATWASLLKK